MRRQQTDRWSAPSCWAASSLGLGAIVLFGNLNLFNPSIRAAIVFQDSIAGLSVGAPVTFRGVRVGAVERISIEFDPKTGVAYIPVTVALEPGRALITERHGRQHRRAWRSLITHGLRAELNVQSFVTGQSQIDLDFDPASPAVLHRDITKSAGNPHTAIDTPEGHGNNSVSCRCVNWRTNAGATLQSLRGLCGEAGSRFAASG